MKEYVDIGKRIIVGVAEVEVKVVRRLGVRNIKFKIQLLVHIPAAVFHFAIFFKNPCAVAPCQKQQEGEYGRKQMRFFHRLHQINGGGAVGGGGAGGGGPC